MKKIIYLLILVCLIACEKDEQNEKIFDSENISSLNLDNIDGFWEAGSEIKTSDYITAHFNNHSGFIDGIRLSSEGRYVGVSVFDSQTIAINAMQARIEGVACVIEEGSTDAINGKWWYSNCVSQYVFVSKINTIIEMSLPSSDSESVYDILNRTANEIVFRIEQQSE